MIAAIRRMMLMIEGKRISPEQLAEISKTYDFRIALAAVLVHAGNVSGCFTETAKDQVRALLVEQLNITAVDASELMVLVNYRNLQWEELEEMVLALGDSLAPESRPHFVEWLWKIVGADHAASLEQASLVAAIADMLGIAKETQISIATAYAGGGAIRLDAASAAQTPPPAGQPFPPALTDAAPPP
jgi:uncharacterized tellurite resistance protein B-like protein